MDNIVYECCPSHFLSYISVLQEKWEWEERYIMERNKFPKMIFVAGVERRYKDMTWPDYSRKDFPMRYRYYRASVANSIQERLNCRGFIPVMYQFI